MWTEVVEIWPVNFGDIDDNHEQEKQGIMTRQESKHFFLNIIALSRQKCSGLGKLALQRENNRSSRKVVKQPEKLSELQKEDKALITLQRIRDCKIKNKNK